MDNPAIVVKNLEYVYPDSKKPALTNINLLINHGEFIAIVGRTGSGKSTLVSLFDGLALPTKGKIIINNIEIDPNTKQTILNKVHHQVGLVFQFPEQQLFAETVADDIAFGPRNLGWSNEAVTAAVDDSLKQVGLANELKTQSPFALSGGQMRRVAIAGVLAMKPSILILDEPTAGLDNKSAKSLLKIISTLQAKGTTVIMITHQMQQVADYADRVVAMSQGKIVIDSAPKKLFANPAQLSNLSLTLPASVQVAHDLLDKGVSLADQEPLTMAKLADTIADVLRRKADE